MQDANVLIKYEHRGKDLEVSDDLCKLIHEVIMWAIQNHPMIMTMPAQRNCTTAPIT
jgi:hypothetical protein